jgi:hypothetical protein
MRLDQPLSNGDAMGTGSSAGSMTIFTVYRFFPLGQFFIELNGIFFHTVVFVIHGVTENVINRHSIGTRRKTLSAAHTTVKTSRFIPVF